ncbi:hypothetical protein IFM89_013497 [Coptis chinensis]|uniref:Uncharacterized protein n=1 Tax=Coptis chinensis TaxID=261450 RepID=A0A835LM24_9MAGN|nr:hypothetical protein IFM89_013497 [Coptis chinensis]
MYSFQPTLARDFTATCLHQRAAPLGRTVLKLLFEKVLTRTNVGDSVSKSLGLAYVCQRNMQNQISRFFPGCKLSDHQMFR